MDEKGEKRRCKRCLLREISESEYKEKLEKYLRMLKADERAEEGIYGKRLAVCKECDKLSGGTCLSCGCYVELRAAVRNSRCPAKKW